MATNNTISPLPLIYIAGPFRGPTPYDVRKNVEAARDVGLWVARNGGYPVIPHTMTADFDKQLDDAFWLAGTLELLRRCDAIYLMKHWQSSQGAQNERVTAQLLQLPIFEYRDYQFADPLVEWIDAWKVNHRVVTT